MRGDFIPKWVGLCLYVLAVAFCAWELARGLFPARLAAAARRRRERALLRRGMTAADVRRYMIAENLDVPVEHVVVDAAESP